MTEEEQAKWYIIRKMREMYPDDIRVRYAAHRFEEGLVADVTAGLIIMIAQHPEYETMLSLLQYGLDVERQQDREVHASARKAVEQWRRVFSEWPRPISMHEGESMESLAKRILWHIEEERE